MRPSLPALTGALAEFPLVGAALALSSVPFQLARIAEATDSLPEIRRDIARVAEATQVLPAMLEEIGKVSQATAVLTEIDAHTRHIERMLPALVELER